MSRKSLQIDEETHTNLAVVAEHFDLTMKRTIKQLVKEEMKRKGLEYKKEIPA